MLPSAHSIVWFLGVFLALWGGSLVARGLWGTRDGKRRCPSCRRNLPEGLVCAACLYEAKSEAEVRACRPRWRRVGSGALVTAAGAGVVLLGFAAYRWITDPDEQDFGLPGPIEAAGVAAAAFGVLLGLWAWRGDRSKGRRRCPRCWYDMAGSGDGLRCPECGREARSSRELYRGRRHRGGVLAAIALLVVGIVIFHTPRVQRGGWVAAVPATALIVGVEWLPDALIWDDVWEADEDWTLDGRDGHGRLWAWQERWVRGWAKRTIKTSRDVGDVERATWFLSEEDTIHRARFVALAGEVADGPPDVRSRAAGLFRVLPVAHMSLAEDGVLAPLTDRLITRLGDPDPEVVHSASWLLVYCGDDAARAVPRLLEVAAAGRANRQFPPAAQALWFIYLHHAAARGAFVEAMSNNDPEIVLQATLSVRMGSVDDPPTRAKLRELLCGADAAIAVEAAEALARSGYELERAAVAILDEIERRAGGRPGLVEALQGLESKGAIEPHLPRVVALLTDEDPGVRGAGAELLGNFGKYLDVDVRAAIPALRALAADPEDPASAKAAEALDALGADVEAPAEGP